MGWCDNYCEKGIIFLAPGAPEIPAAPIITGPLCGPTIYVAGRIVKMKPATACLIVCQKHPTELKKPM